MNLTLSNSQNIFLNSTNHCAMFSGLGSGKTWIGTLWGSIQAIKYPGSIGLIGANNPAQLHSVVVPSLKKHLDDLGIEYYIGEAPPWKSPFESHVNVVSIAGGSYILLRSVFESGADRGIRGVELSWAYLDEVRELEEGVFDIVNGRMRNKIGSRLIRLTSTPNGKKGWIYRRLISSPPPNWQIVRGCTHDNADNLPAGYIEGLKSTYSTNQYSQEVLGNWLDMQEGLAFRFDRQKHCCFKAMDLNKPILVGMDLNVSPLIAVIGQMPTERTMHIFHEVVLHDNAQTRVACEVIAQRYASKFAEAWYLCDESGGSRSTRTLETDVQIMDGTMRRLFKRARSLNGPAKPRVIDRYNSVNALLDPADGIIKLTVDPTCKELITDMESVSWDDYGKIDKSDGKRTHAGDALGYLVHRLIPIGSEAQSFGLNGSLEVSEYKQKSPAERGFPAPASFAADAFDR